uniref:Polyprotein n=1 Tax=Cucumis melo alphaendornavirus TaxID=1776177 RepID=A0A4P2UPL6_9VIRU|nr:polyprotein [Cucumis melo alphaendornavirus]
MKYKDYKPIKKVVKPSVVKREFSNKLQGWIKLPRNCRMSLNKNPFQTSFRKVFKENKSLIFDKNKIKLVPAIRGVKKFRDTCGSVAANIRFEDPLAGVVNFEAMQPLDIARIYYNVISGGCEIWKPPHKPISDYLNHTKHEGLDDEEDEEEMFLDSNNLDNNLIVRIVGPGRGNCTSEMLEVLNKLVAKFGGYEAYYNVYLETQHRHFGYLQKEDNGKYSFINAKFNPLKKCSVCKYMNHYEEMIRGLRMVHYSLKHYRPKSKVVTDEFLTTYNVGDVIEDVPWRCGYCFSDLNLQVFMREDRLQELIQIVTQHLFVLMGDIEQLLKMGYGDLYDDMDVASKEKLKSADQVIVNEYFYHLQRKIIPVGHDFDAAQSKTITEVLGGCFFKPQSKLNSVKPEFIAELSTLTELIEKSCASKQVASVGQILPGSSKENVHHWMHDSTWYSPDPAVFCSNEKVCGHKHNYIVYAGPGIYNRSLSNILALVDEQRTLQIITPIKTNQNTLADGTGAYQRTNEHLNLYLDGNPTPLKLKLDTYTIINNYQFIKLDDKLYYIMETQKLKLTKIMTIVGPFSDKVTYPQKLIKDDKGVKLRMYLPNIDSFMGDFRGLNYEEQEFELNVSLFRYLCLRNTSGKVSHDTLRSYAVGYSLRRFVVHSKVVSNPTIVYQDIDIHVILSRVCMMKLRNCYDISYGYSQFAKKLGPFRSWLGDVESAMTSSFLGLINKLVTDALGLDWNVVLNFIDDIRLQTLIDGISSTNFWEKLLAMAENINTEDVKVVDLDQGVDVFLGPNIGSCDHHKETCEHVGHTGNNRCLCCNMPITEFEFCDCCTPNKKEAGNFFDVEEAIKNESKAETELKKTNPARKDVLSQLVNEIEKLVSSKEAAKNGVEKSSHWKQTFKNVAEGIKQGVSNQINRAIESSVPSVEGTKQTQTESADEVKPTQTDEPPKTEEIPTSSEGWKRVTRRKYNDPQDMSDRMVVETLDKLQPLTVSSDSAEAIQILGYDFVSHCLNPMEYENILNDGTKTMYTMPHLPMGETVSQNRVFEVTTKIVIPNSDAMTCAYDAYKYGYATASLEEMIAINEGPPPLSTTVLTVVDKARKENLIIIGSTGTLPYTTKFWSSNNYHCIWFDEPELGGVGHFMPAIIRRSSGDPFYFAHTLPGSLDERNQLMKLHYGPGTSMLTLPESFNGKENLLMELTFYNLHTYMSNNTSTSLLTIEKKDGRVFLTNNKDSKVHATNREKIHIEIPSHLCKFADKLQLALQFKLTAEDVPEMRHISDELPNNYEYEIEEEVNEILRSFIRVSNVQSGLDAKDIKFPYKGKLTSWYGRSKFLLLGGETHKMKRYDVLALKVDRKIELVYVLGTEGNSVILDKPVITSQEVTVYELKESIGSKIRLLVGLCQPHISIQSLKNKLSVAKYITGPAGYGKSTMIAQQAKAGDLCVAMTSTSVQALRLKCKKDVSVLSMERAIYDHCKTNGTLFIDEATMANWLHLGYLCGEDAQIMLYGADNQIGKKDMSATPGVRYNVTVKDFLKKENIIKEYHSYRIGEPMVNLLQPIEPGMTSKADHKTTYNITTLDDTEFENIKTIVTRANPYVIITPYSHNRNKIKALLGSLDVKVVTTHSFQGMEVNTALVVLREDINRSRELNGNPEYLNSALTRAKFHTDIVVYGQYGTITDLHPLLRRVGGMPNLKKLIAPSSSKIPMKDKGIIIDPDTGLPLEINIRNMHNLTQNMVDKLNDLSISNSGVTLNYEKLADGTRVVAKLGNSTVSTVTNKNGVIDVQANSFIKNKIMNNLDTNITIPVQKEKIDPNYNVIELINVSFIPPSKLRELAWMVDKGVGKTMEITLGGERIKVTKDSGCPLFSGATFECKDEKLKISNGWQSWTKRKLYFNKNIEYVRLSPIINWLELSHSELRHHKLKSIGWLDVMKGDTVHTLWQFQERLTQIHLWLLNFLTAIENHKCYFNNVKNVSRYNKLARSLGLPPVSHHQSVVYHENFIVNTKFGWWRQNKYTLGNGDEIVAEVSSRDNEVVWRVFAMECLADMRHTYPKCQGISGTDFDIPGLHVPLHKHMAKNTAIHQLVCTNLAKIKEQIQPHTHDIVRMDKRGMALVKNYLNQKYPKMTLTTGSYELPNSPIEIALEQLMINMVGSLVKNSVNLVAYAGYVPLAVAILGKYYIKMAIPPLDEYGRFYYDMSKPQLDSMLDHFNSTRTKKVEWYIGTETRLERLLLGTRLSCMTPRKIDEALNQTKNVYGWLPMFRKSTDNYNYDHKNSLLSFKHGKLSNPLNPELFNCGLNGKPIFVNSKENYYLEMSTLTETFDHRLVQITKRQIPIERYIDRRIGSYSEMNNKLTINVPWIDLDLLRIMSDRQILTIKELVINKKLLRNILLRLMTGEDSHDDALNYARTLESTQVITDKGIDDLSTTNLVVTLNTTWYAIYIHNDYLRKFQSLIYAVNSTQGRPLAVGLLEQLISGFSKLLGKVSVVAQDICEKYLTKLNSAINLTNKMADCIEEAKKTNWAPEMRNVYFNRFYFHDDDLGDINAWFKPGDDDDDNFDDNRNLKRQMMEEENDYFDPQVESNIGRYRSILDKGKSPPTSNYEEPMNVSTSKNQQCPKTSSDQQTDDDETDFEDALSSHEDSNELIERTPTNEQIANEDVTFIISSDNTLYLEQKFEDLMCRKKILRYLEQLCQYKQMTQVVLKKSLDILHAELNKNKEFNFDDYTVLVNAGLCQQDDFASPKYNVTPLNKIEIPTISKWGVKPIKYVRNNYHMIPKVIWTYWHSNVTSRVIKKCMDSIQHHNPDYEVIVITDKNIQVYLTIDNFPASTSRILEAKSDWIRLNLLLKYGGIWVDASSIGISSFDDCLQEAIDSPTGVLQVSLSSKEEPVKVYENWFVVAPPHNPLIKEWLRLFEEVLARNVVDLFALDAYLEDKFIEYSAVKVKLGDSKRFYLKCYLTETLVSRETGLKPVAVIADDRRVDVHHDVKWEDWNKIALMYCLKHDGKMKVPIVKIIDIHRRNLEYYLNMGGAVEPESWLGQANNTANLVGVITDPELPSKIMELINSHYVKMCIDNKILAHKKSSVNKIHKQIIKILGDKVDVKITDSLSKIGNVLFELGLLLILNKYELQDLISKIGELEDVNQMNEIRIVDFIEQTLNIKSRHRYKLVTSNLVQINRSNKYPSKPKYAERNGIKIPLIIWSYWDDTTVNQFQLDMIDNWHYQNQEYRIVIINKNSLSRMLSKSTYELIMGQTPQYRSDWVRLFVLQQIGGVWVDSTGIFQDSVHPLVLETLTHESGMYQVSIQPRTTSPRYYESWFIIATENNKLMKQWFDNLHEMTKHVHPSGSNALRWIEPNFGEYYNASKHLIVPNLRVYLRVCLIGVITCMQLGTEPLSICEDEGEVSMFHKLPRNKWLNFWKLLTEEPDEQCKVTFPFIKWIGMQRSIIFRNFNPAINPRPGSLLDQQMYKIEIDYDVTKAGEMVIPNKHSEALVAKPIVISQYRQASTLIMCIGSGGDILQFIALYDILESIGMPPLIIIHVDHAKTLGNRRKHLLSITAESIMETVDTKLTKIDLSSDTRSMRQMKIMVKELEEIAFNYAHFSKFIIINSAVPKLKCFSEIAEFKIIEISTFPVDWVFGDNTSDKGHSAGIRLKRWIFNMMSDRKKIHDFESRYSYYNSCSKLLYPEGDKFIGPLTLWGYKSTADYITLSNRDILVTFGSCDKTISVDHKLSLMDNLITMGHSIIYHDPYRLCSIGTRMCDEVHKRQGKIIVIESFDLRKVIGSELIMLTHGGHGTVMEGLMAGFKLVIHPIIADQFQWAKRLRDLKLASIIYDISDREQCEVALIEVNRHIKYSEVLGSVQSIDTLKFLRTINPKALFYDPSVSLRALRGEGILDQQVTYKKGIYRIRNVAFSIKYNPVVVDKCVYESTIHQLTPEGELEFSMLRVLSSNKLKESAVTERDLIDGVLSMGLNIAIIYNNGSGVVHNVFNSKCLTYHIDRSCLPWHVSVPEVMSYQEGEVMNMLATPVRELQHVVITERDNWRSDFSVIELTNPRVLCLNQGKKKIDNLTARLRGFMLNELGSRAEIHCCRLELRRHGYVHVGDYAAPDQPLSVGCITSDQGWMLVTWQVKNNQMIIYGEQGIYTYSVLVNLHIQVGIPKAPKAILSKTIELMSLNKTTKQHTIINNLNPRSSQIVSSYMQKYRLIVSDYDNRDHHMYDEMTLLKRASEIIFHSNRKVTLDDFVESHGAAYNRLTLKQGMAIFEHYFEDKDIGALVVGAHNRYDRDKGGFETANRLDDDTIAFIQHYFYNLNGKLIARDTWEINGVEILSHDEILPHTNSAIMFTLSEKENLRTVIKKHPHWEVARLTLAELKKNPIIHVQTTDNGCIILQNYLIILRPPKLGGDSELERQWWRITHRKTESLPTPGNWWGMKVKESNKTKSNFNDVMAINELHYHEPTTLSIALSDDVEYQPPMDIYIAPYESVYPGSILEPLTDLPDTIAMQLWEDNDLTNWLNLYAPLNNCIIKSRELPGKIIKSEKLTMVKYPIRSRAVLTKVCFEEGRSIIGRMKSVAMIRTKTPNPYRLTLDIADTYFRPDWQQMINNYRQELLIIRPKDVKKWIEENKDCEKIERELIDLLCGELISKPINDVNVHLKLESLLKENFTIMTMQQQARIIVWQRKAVCAIYSNLFVEVKRRLKEVLHRKIVYADGLRPDEISARVRLVKNVAGFFENDLTKQDRQTDKPIIEVELMIYDLLGVHPNVIASWKEMHEVWRFKSNLYWGQGEGMRLTGQATTALGNCLTNLQVHQNFTKTNFCILQLGLFLGDDMCMVFSEKPDTSNLRKDIATSFNMQSKDSWVINGATFCSMVMTRTNFGAELAPDVVRLKFRYEVPNGVHEATPTNVLMRKASYLMMLGKGPNVDDTVRMLNLPIKPIAWYNFDHMVTAVAHKYNMNEEQVRGYYDQLLATIRSDNIYSHVFRHFSNK